MFGFGRRYPLITFTIKFGTCSLVWQSTVRKVLNRSWSIRSFMIHDYGVEVTGRIDPGRLLWKLSRAGIRGRVCGGAFRGDYAYRYGYFLDRPYGSFRGSCNLNRGVYDEPIFYDGDYCMNQCHSDIPPGPFAKVAHELLDHHHHPRQNFHYVRSSSVGCLPWL